MLRKKYQKNKYLDKKKYLQLKIASINKIIRRPKFIHYIHDFVSNSFNSFNNYNNEDHHSAAAICILFLICLI